MSKKTQAQYLGQSSPYQNLTVLMTLIRKYSYNLYIVIFSLTPSHTNFTPENYKKGSYNFGTDTRFKYNKQEEIIRDRAPGPGAYKSTGSFKKASRVQAGFGLSQKLSDNVYLKECKSSYLSKHAPGPGTYKASSFIDHPKPGGKIIPSEYNPRMDTRKGGKMFKISNLSKLDDHSQFIKLKTRKGRMKFSTAERDYDPIFAAKGLYSYKI